MKKVDDFFDEAIENIRGDRALAMDLLVDIMGQIKGSSEAGHRSEGQTAAKYLETLQRSNEQLVKIVSLMNKKSEASVRLTDKDKNEIFDFLNDSNNVN